MKELSAWKQLLYIALLVIGGYILANIGTLIALALMTIIGYENIIANRSALLVVQFFTQVVVFILPAYIYLKVQKKPIIETLDLDKKSSLRSFIYGVGLLLLSLPVVDLLNKVNQNMVLPQSWATLEVFLKTMENQALLMTETMLNTTSMFGLFNVIVVMALMPALSEEILFRAIIQKAFCRALKNPHIAIIVTSIIFSAIHFQFYGFLPRFFIGLILGYTYFYTRNLWIPIMIHFLNNSTSVILYFLWNRGLINVNPLTDTSIAPEDMTVLFALLAIGVVMYELYKREQKQTLQ